MLFETSFQEKQGSLQGYLVLILLVPVLFVMVRVLQGLMLHLRILLPFAVKLVVEVDIRSEERRVGKEGGFTRSKRDWSSDVCSSDLSTLATYMGIMDAIRNIFSRETGQPAGLFSFNSIGACPVCHGKGVTRPDVAFADPVTIRCEACGGSRY